MNCHEIQSPILCEDALPKRERRERDEEKAITNGKRREPSTVFLRYLSIHRWKLNSQILD